ncbi:MAG TPA: alcohol dehydrogenase [Ruminococcaceae bacterium]|nr:alcohol dehydrogenase [Oscillospiraceae bacterium]
MKQTVAKLTSRQNIEITQEEPAKLLPGHVRVRIETVGICGSDVYFFESGHCGPDVLPFPIVLGHECAGTVLETGEGVTHLKAGDLVCLEPGVPCGHCEYCVQGRYNLCPDVEFMAAPPNYVGCLRETVVHPAHLTFKLPKGMTSVDGAMIEPLSVGFHAAKQGGAAFGKRVLILGAGCIGLMTLMACKAMGVADITVVDLFENRLDLALKLGAARVVDASKRDTAEACREALPGGADIVFETAGSAATTRQTGGLVKTGGVIVLVGNTHGDVPYDFFEIMNKEITVRCVFRYAGIYPLALDAVAKGLIDPAQVITHRFGFDETQQAFMRSVTDKKDIVKGIIEIVAN